MIKAICINDKEKPSEILQEKWIKFKEWYTITHIFIHPEQNGIQGVYLKELNLKGCSPYNTYKLSRFAVREKDIPELIRLAQLCSELDSVQVENLIKQEFYG